ncbi:MAG: FG-GAP-like repeat-containing protein [Bacteroidota bacterium]
MNTTTNTKGENPLLSYWSEIIFYSIRVLFGKKTISSFRILRLLPFCLLLVGPMGLKAQFTQISGANGLDFSASTSGGHAWGDLDNDGDLDVIMHNGLSGAGAKLFINNGAGSSFTFTDRTDSLIDGFNDHVNYARQLLIADMNNDGYNDILRGGGGGSVIEIYFNQGPPAFEFGDANEQPNFSINSSLNNDFREYNLEGAGVIDWNTDGYLDVIVDNNSGGLDLYQNNGDSTFIFVQPGTAVGQSGLLAGHSGVGDYLTLGDVNNDGYVDLMSRKQSVDGFWRFDAASQQFIQQSDITNRTSEGDKGGVMFCDLDNDGDLDLFWTARGNNEVWRNDGVDGSNNIVWTSLGLPGAGAIGTQSHIDGCDCGDVDNDGDLDIVLGASSGNSYLLENLLTADDTISFNPINIATNANTESLNLVDFDNDGDLDIYFVVDGSANQLWQNTGSTSNYLYVDARFDNGNGSSRSAIGANIILSDCLGNTLATRHVNGSKGHGSQHVAKVHFGLDPGTAYQVAVYYIYENGSRSVVRRSVLPTAEAQQTITIVDTDASLSTYCLDNDGDGIDNLQDQDDDNDGIPDYKEVCGATATDFSYLNTILYDGANNGLDPVGDEDGDGILNYEDANDPAVNHASCTDANADGRCDALNSSLDFDGDGLPDLFDLDTDNDGLPDVVEAGAADANNDGKVDGLNPDGTLLADIDDDGLWDTYDPINDLTTNPLGTAIANHNSDGRGNSDFKDLDSDDDGVTDVVENASGDTSADAASGNLDGRVDGYTDVADLNGWNDNSNSTTVDTDGDGIADYRDLDADNDGIPDNMENVCTSCPTFGTTAGTDANSNGILDVFENITADNTDNINGLNLGISPHEDADDNSNTPDYLDIDTDKDNAYDWAEGFDTDGDGNAMNELIDCANAYDAFTGASPAYFSSTDSDADNIPDWLDNQNGTSGYDESQRPPFLNPTSIHWYDENGNGLADIFDVAMGGVLAPTPDQNSSGDDDWREPLTLVFLPVELFSFAFEVVGCEVQLNWATESEVNFSHFLLERSDNGNDFKTLERIDASGGVEQIGAYHYYDKNANGRNYYRLKMVDLDGSYEYSSIVYAPTDCSGAYGLMDVYPNPLNTATDGILTIKLYTSEHNVRLTLTDLNGQPIRVMTLPVEEGWNTLRMDLSFLPSGIYHLSSEIDGNKKTKQIVRFNED